MGPQQARTHYIDCRRNRDYSYVRDIYKHSPLKRSPPSPPPGSDLIVNRYQLIRGIFKNPEDKTNVTLVFGNLTENDILLKSELDHLQNTYPRRFKVLYLLDNAPKDAGWATQGYVTKELLKTVLPEPGAGNNKIFVILGLPGDIFWIKF